MLGRCDVECLEHFSAAFELTDNRSKLDDLGARTEKCQNLLMRCFTWAHQSYQKRFTVYLVQSTDGRNVIFRLGSRGMFAGPFMYGSTKVKNLFKIALAL